MKSRFILILILFSFCAAGKLTAQSVNKILTISSWAPSILLQGLRVADTLVLDQKAGENYGYLEFSGDSILKQCQSEHYCVRTSKNGYAMKLDYRWFKRGRWKISERNLELDLETEKIICRLCNKSVTQVKYIIDGITRQ